MFSALKRDGQPLYKLARAGIEVERAARDIEIFRAAPVVGKPVGAGLGRVGRSGTVGARSAVLEGDLRSDAGRGHRKSTRYLRSRRGTEACLRGAVCRSTDGDAGVDRASRETGTLPMILAADAALQHMHAVRLDAQATVRMMHGQAGDPERMWVFGARSALRRRRDLPRNRRIRRGRERTPQAAVRLEATESHAFRSPDQKRRRRL